MFRQVNSSESEVKRFQDRLNPTSLSPEAIQDALGAIAKLAKGRFTEIKSMVEKRIGPREAENILSPQAQAAMDRFEKLAPGTQSPGSTAAPMTATNPKTGQKIRSLDGGKTWQQVQ
jgi:hypothetical protein